MRQMELLSPVFSVCKGVSPNDIDWNAPFVFAAKTDREVSLVLPESFVPPTATARADGWRALRVAGTLEFSLLGILAEITRLLAEAKVSVFCVSTYDTDYVLVKQERLRDAISALKTAGWTVTE